jgi:uncharacterized membrane protein HdeD (DUF308 family)
MGDVLYATLFGAFVSIGVWAMLWAIVLLAAESTLSEEARGAWMGIIGAVALCAGISAGYGVRWQRRRRATRS